MLVGLCDISLAGGVVTVAGGGVTTLTLDGATATLLEAAGLAELDPNAEGPPLNGVSA